MITNIIIIIMMGKQNSFFVVFFLFNGNFIIIFPRKIRTLITSNIFFIFTYVNHILFLLLSWDWSSAFNSLTGQVYFPHIRDKRGLRRFVSGYVHTILETPSRFWSEIVPHVRSLFLVMIFVGSVKAKK